jgi:phage N-6-adenine-methyltransferase
MATPQQKPGRSRQDYRTPDDFTAAVKRRLGIAGFVHDFAAHAENTQARTWFGPGSDSYTDALVAPSWSRYCRHGWGWLNPEFSNIEPWAKRCAATAAEGGHIALLVPASIGADWFRDHVDGRALVLALNGRLAFIDGKPRDLYPKDCLLALYSPLVAPGFEVWSWRTQLRGKAAA